LKDLWLQEYRTITQGEPERIIDDDYAYATGKIMNFSKVQFAATQLETWV
jgi:hypothetical protein